MKEWSGLTFEGIRIELYKNNNDKGTRGTRSDSLNIDYTSS